MTAPKRNALFVLHGVPDDDEGFRACIAYALPIPLTITNSRAADQSSDLSVSIDEILTAVQTALTDTQNVLYSSKMPPLKGVTLELQAVFSESADAGFNLYVISANGKLTSESTQKLILSLAPPSPEQIAPAASPKVIGQSLKNSLVQAARGVQKAAGRSPPLQVKELKAEIEFVVEKEGNADVGWKFFLAPIEAKMEGAISSGAIQRVNVDFGY
jgi:hypothetical protein